MKFSLTCNEIGHKRPFLLGFMIFIIFFSAFVISTAFAEKKKTKVHTLILNPGSSKSAKLFKNWDQILNRNDLYKWGRSNGLLLINDKPPVIDNKAGFISAFGSSITVKGLKREKFYRMWIDFVTYKKKKGLVPAKLKIYISNGNSSPSHLKTLFYRDIHENRRYLIDIPYKFTVKGRINIIFEEYSQGNGFWGIWDIVIFSNS